MKPPTGYWGIDIGQCALKAIRLEIVEGHPTATAFDYVEHPKILSQPDADPDVLIREALEKFLSRNEIGHDNVAIGIAGQSGLARFVKLPPVEEKKIGDIVKFEAKQQIPFPLDEVVWDYQKIAGGAVTDGFAMETEIGLFAMKRDVIARYLGYFNSAKLEVHLVQMSPLALVNFATYEVLRKGGSVPAPVNPDEPPLEEIPRGKKRCVVVLDIGTDGSNLIITDGEKIIWQRPLPLGGNNFTRALTKDLKLTFAKAEHLKRNAAKSPELPQILKALKPVLTDFVGEVQRSLGYFTNTHRDAHVEYMVGLGSAFRLPGLQKYLSEKLQIDVRKPGKYARIVGDGVLNDPIFQENLLTFPVAYGLALQGIGEARLITNLLPQEIRTDRLIRAKKPYAVAAAAALILGTGAISLGFSASLKAVSDPSIATAMTKSKDAISAYTSQENKLTQKLKEVTTVQNDLKVINAGQDERLNWPRFQEVFSEALPWPGDKGNLNSDPAQIMLVGTAGKEALTWFENRMRKGVPVEQAAADAASKHPEDLAVINVEGVYCRWVANLPVFFTATDNFIVDRYKENIADSMKPEERERDEAKNRDKPKIADGPGWVIEIRGYTYHKGGAVFARDTLIKNLQRMDAFATPGEKKVGKIVAGVADPVKGKVSHGFLYHVWLDETQPQGVTNLNKYFLDEILALSPPVNAAPGSAAAAPPPAAPSPAAPSTSAPMAPSAPFGDKWEPLTNYFDVPPTPATVAPAPTTTVPGAKVEPPRRRYEFVVMVVWREPTPSADASAPGAGTAVPGTTPKP